MAKFLWPMTVTDSDEGLLMAIMLREFLLVLAVPNNYIVCKLMHTHVHIDSIVCI